MGRFTGKAFLAEETVQSRKEHGSPGSERKYSWSQNDREGRAARGRGGLKREAGARPPPARHTKKFDILQATVNHLH